jgi:DNA-binding MarR family transcriptional regulator
MRALTGKETTDFVLAQVSHLHHRRVRALLEDLGLYRGQPPMLHMLWEQDGRNHSELAAALNVQPATITKMVQRMERAGFVQRRSDPADQRVSRVFLTDEGRAVQSAVLQAFVRLEQDTLAGLSDTERQTLHALLLRIRANLLAVLGGSPHCWGLPETSSGADPESASEERA